jgi:hypothetical protein
MKRTDEDITTVLKFYRTQLGRSSNEIIMKHERCGYSNKNRLFELRTRVKSDKGHTVWQWLI